MSVEIAYEEWMEAVLADQPEEGFTRQELQDKTGWGTAKALSYIRQRVKGGELIPSKKKILTMTNVEKLVDSYCLKK